ncbi:hypothetical protein QJU43_02225 [Pasteurella atlantica]|uniref:Uncharacterized protein n=2 Tax=Pasteurellaceae TaxID=712 RepID=A0ACC6HKA6_9PAST|nr:hypothetical protein [Pasteurella atlantica]MDP8033108.1 hypothetical protein [Pasteurella atlantica]MDP8035045.1 hypothetical protein [Pasteurella atlantica]MDP8036995.1 hypothetical protein [Pasteurella atlantica]MDP8047479.1 hypothetical protein [Pasteurella atlantica]MDP8049148.1 hypothetical protein [Pasteurella atlantica]
MCRVTLRLTRPTKSFQKIKSKKRVNSYKEVAFIGVLVDYLNHNPQDEKIRKKVNKTIKLTYESLCNSTLKVDNRGYTFRKFSRKGVFSIEFLTEANQKRLLYIVGKELSN